MSVGPASNPQLPVAEARAAIVRMIRRNHAVVIVGETGSGKTTQIPQYVWDDIISKGRRGIVGCTQPRRVAAVSIAKHVAHQRGCRVGDEVAYAVRFDDTCTSKTKIKFMTDGILLREIQADPDLSHYGCLILDEAHERTLHGDVLYGLLKDIVRTRRYKDLSIVVMSATLNAEHFSKFWWGAPIGVVHGRTYPVAIFHTLKPQVNYVEAAVSTVLKIHFEEKPGDVLCFLTGREEIEDAKRMIERRMKLVQNDDSSVAVLTLYSAMPYEQQMAVFDPAPDGVRKIILATNIAETSITVEGIRYVVDSGVVKAKRFCNKTRMEVLDVVDISQAQAMQRAGRAGRMAAGKCFRLYVSKDFESFAENTVPEIKRSSLVSVVLQMKSLRIDRVAEFEFMDAPPLSALARAEETLQLLGALDQNGIITPLGLRLTDFPIEPMASTTLLAAKALGVEHDAVVAVAMTSTENIFITSPEFKEKGDKCRAIFSKSCGDHATAVSLYQAYKRLPKEQRRAWCEANCISHRQMLRVEDVITQLTMILDEHDDESLLAGLVPASIRAAVGGGHLSRQESRHNEEECTTNHLYRAEAEDSGSRLPSASERYRDFELLRRALCCGYCLNVAFFDVRSGHFQTVVGHQRVYLHPSSVLFDHRRKPALVVFNSVVRTTKRYMKEVSVVHEDWLRESATFSRLLK